MHWESCPAVERKAGKISGAWAFTGTRVPVYALFENLAGGATIDEFVEWFPGVGRQQVQAVLEHEAKALRKGADPLKLLFDQGRSTPSRLQLGAHAVDTLAERGWSDKDNRCTRFARLPRRNKPTR